ncbi:hypothetical protein GCM10009668_22090 [Nocardioides dubius]|uniref:Uncharacterized protein n=1 Tax=Nocardioides dubius TaxID=317019 RepID=A0ABP4EFT8_9ACTN
MTDTVENHVEALAQLYSENRSGELILMVSDELFATLSAADMFPLKEKYQELLGESNIHHISAGDLSRIVLRILDQAEILEDLVVDREIAGCSCCGTGIMAACECHEEFNAALGATLHSYAAITLVDRSKAATFLATRRNFSRLQWSVEFSAIMTDRDELFEDVGVDLDLLAVQTCSSLLTLESSQELVLSIDIDDHFGEVAVAASIRQFDLRDGSERWSLGPRFVDSAAHAGVHKVPGLANKFLRACAEVVSNPSQRDSHWLRTSIGGSSPQRKNGGAAAWRADIDREWHLHYWLMPDGSVQLSCVVPHNSFDIAPPDFGAKVQSIH